LFLMNIPLDVWRCGSPERCNPEIFASSSA
jgi:hypothetical protein